MSSLHCKVFSTLQRYPEYIRGYLEYIEEGCSENWRDIMIHVGGGGEGIS